MQAHEVTIRPARPDDDAIIKQMVWQARLDPTSLKWQNFLVAEHNGEIAGIGQVKPHADCRELGSLVTKGSYRGQGIASQIIDALQQNARFPLYLMCAAQMEAFYQGFGYQRISWWAAPRTLKLKLAPAILFRIVGIRVLVMCKTGL